VKGNGIMLKYGGICSTESVDDVAGRHCWWKGNCNMGSGDVEEVVGWNSSCWWKGIGWVKGGMLGNGIMLKCNGSGNSSEGSKHGGEGNPIGNQAAVGEAGTLSVGCACCMCKLLGGVERCMRAGVGCFAFRLQN
jgi:hypothetical protein